MMMLSSVCPSIDSCGTLVVNGLQQDFVLLTTIVSPFSQSTSWSVYLIQLHLFVYEDVMGDSVENLAEMEINNIHCSPLIHWACLFIEE